MLPQLTLSLPAAKEMQHKSHALMALTLFLLSPVGTCLHASTSECKESETPAAPALLYPLGSDIRLIEIKSHSMSTTGLFLDLGALYLHKARVGPI